MSGFTGTSGERAGIVHPAEYFISESLYLPEIVQMLYEGAIVWVVRKDGTAVRYEDYEGGFKCD